MAKENVAKFYEKLAEDTALAEKLDALDKDFAEKNEGPADDAAMREKAVEAIIIPLAKEVGLPFTIDELKEYEQEQLAAMKLSEDELAQVAGGKRTPVKCNKLKGRCGAAACYYVGVGLGRVRKDGKTAFCILIGGSDGDVAGTDD